MKILILFSFSFALLCTSCEVTQKEDPNWVAVKGPLRGYSPDLQITGAEWAEVLLEHNAISWHLVDLLPGSEVGADGVTATKIVPIDERWRKNLRTLAAEKTILFYVEGKSKNDSRFVRGYYHVTQDIER